VPLVVDASVVAKWFFNEEHSDSARLLMARMPELLAPDFLRVELAAIAWKKARRGQIPVARVTEFPPHIADLSLRFVRDQSLLQGAADIAVRYDRSIYDSLYVALALQEGCQFVTADLRLYNGLRDDLPQTMLWVEDLALRQDD
jgi:predicted nucleic acid-binding protein